jgi:hypothetical protein
MFQAIEFENHSDLSADGSLRGDSEIDPIDAQQILFDQTTITISDSNSDTSSEPEFDDFENGVYEGFEDMWDDNNHVFSRLMSSEKEVYNFVWDGPQAFDGDEMLFRNDEDDGEFIIFCNDVLYALPP